MELINFDNLQEVLEEYAREVRNAYQDRLIKNGRIASGDLLNSIDYHVEKNGTMYEVSLTLEDYWKYVEYDTKPHFPPLDKILEWIMVKPILPRPNDNGDIPTPRQLAYLIGRAMAGKSPNQANTKNPNGGTKGTHDLEDAINEINAKYKDMMIYALHKDMERLMKVAIGGIQGSMPS